jgi:signal transduction histidine kinase
VLVAYMSLIMLLLVALEVPLGLSFAMNDYHHLVISRINDNVRFAAQAAPVLAGNGDREALRETMRRYQRRTGVSVVLVDRNGTVVDSSPAGVRITDRGRRARLSRALSGMTADALDYPYNVHAKPLFLAEPVVQWPTVLGGVVTISPTKALRAHVAKRVAILVAIGVGVLAAAVLLVIPLTRWILRPVKMLGATALAVATGDYDVRAPTDTGPPEMRRLAHVFNAMADRLVTVLGAQRGFVADVSHQLRNPLTALRLRVEGLELYVSNNSAEGRAAVGKATDEVERVCGILDGILRIARDQGHEVPAQRVDARSVAENRVDAWRTVAEQRDVEVSAEGVPAAASCAPEILDQVLDVLLDNAVQLSPPGGRVRVRTTTRDGAVEVHVIDQGPGMTAQDKARATDRFWRGSVSDEKEGSGLGLSIAVTLLAAVGGSLTFRDASPHGVNAVIRLSAWREPTRPPREQLRKYPPAGADAQVTGLNQREP